MKIPTCSVCGENPCRITPECITNHAQEFPPTRAELEDILARLVRIEELLGVGVKVALAYRCAGCGTQIWPGSVLPMEPGQLMPTCPECGGLLKFWSQPKPS